MFNSKGDFLISRSFISKQEQLISALQKFLTKGKVKSKDLKSVLVISGPGSFTASRAGIVLANSFNFLYGVPVLGVKNEDIKVKEFIKKNLSRLKRAKKTSVAKVYYNRKPNITKKK
ncbi:hypothetical protein ACFL29_01470 [Patescibacteria group bacterium]